jgi:hypothetical protein
LHRASPEPERVFSPHQWTEFAKAISLDRISSDEKREICDAIFAYEFDRIAIERAADKAEEKNPIRRKVDPRAKGRAALGNFVKYTRGLRHALYSVQNYLKNEPLIEEAKQLSEQIYDFQKLAKRELDKKSLGGRPALKIRDDLVIQLSAIYERLTGEKPKGAAIKNGRIYGRFPKFVYAIFRAHGIDEGGLRNAIAKAVRYANNQH